MPMKKTVKQLLIILNKMGINTHKNLRIIRNSKYFDSHWYKENYMKNTSEIPELHYLETGWKKLYNPSKNFSTLRYIINHEDVHETGFNPLLHYELYGKKENRTLINEDKLTKNEVLEVKKHVEIQNERISLEYNLNSKKAVVFLVPPKDYVGGGLMSICSIARVTKDLEFMKDSAIILATMPSVKTVSKFTKFECGFNIYRFNMLPEYFKELDEIIIHIPELYIRDFMLNLSPMDILWLQKIKFSTINILNQNNQLMPRPEAFDFAKILVKNTTMTCAHKNYCNSNMRSSYDMSVHLFSASNLVEYKYRSYKEKENLLVYSNDKNPFKVEVINKIKQQLPQLKVKEINNMSYDQYREIISKAKWMITFGEGLDGYFVESARCGAIPFAAYNNIFFEDSFANLPVVYNGYSTMLDHIVEDIKSLDNEKEYEELNQKIIAIDKKQYDDDEYKKNIENYYLGKFTFPIETVQEERKKRIEKQPLISIVMATYNGEKYIVKQIESLINQDYLNKEIIISDDGSTDQTINIINEYIDRSNGLIKLFHNDKKGINNNFTNGILKAKGEYIALCDHDDIWLENKLSRMMERIDEFDIVHCNMSIIDKEDNYHSNPVFHAEYEKDKTNMINFSDFIYENPILGCATLIKKEAILNSLPIPEEAIYHDWWIALHVVKYGIGVIFLDEKLIKYRQHGNNLAKTNFDRGDYFNKKIKFDKYLIGKWTDDLEVKEKIFIENDINLCYMYNVFKQYVPNKLNEFVIKNKHGFSKNMMKSLRKTLDDMEKDGE